MDAVKNKELAGNIRKALKKVIRLIDPERSELEAALFEHAIHIDTLAEEIESDLKDGSDQPTNGIY